MTFSRAICLALANRARFALLNFGVTLLPTSYVEVVNGES